MDVKAVLVDDRPLNRADDFGCIQIADLGSVYLLNDNQPFLAIHVNAECRPAIRSQRRVALLDC